MLVRATTYALHSQKSCTNIRRTIKLTGANHSRSENNRKRKLTSASSQADKALPACQSARYLRNPCTPKNTYQQMCFMRRRTCPTKHINQHSTHTKVNPVGSGAGGRVPVRWLEWKSLHVKIVTWHVKRSYFVCINLLHTYCVS